ncbi:TetR/AcrR family transcriptional regulator [Mucilaginibacter conchicola]|uniref:TetR/AcrR family transcriptional regulator n=1 Tax=Mucilaginibacter conchicola TaxID=2303333 RepID=A0A372NNR7_9SPHI|nr:TetR/AcrR family transcriptional regulator [Mucilaginibacter conchicola]RFZ90025.1 TetR/AcrR family transcriptional regulator [Mucilaginibacter conchicola]
MPAKDTGTEELIRSTAKKLFFKEGKLHATTQDIADAAGMNRSAVHYYFRTRDQLIALIFAESMQALSLRLGKVMSAELPFREKIQGLIEVFTNEMMEYPFQEVFLVTEINTAGHDLVTKIDEGPVSSFLNEIEKEMHLGTIEKTDPKHFLINLFSLLSYPIMMSPIYRQFFGMNEHQFDELIAERRELITRTMFK